jgi:hypothetical protein
MICNVANVAIVGKMQCETKGEKIAEKQKIKHKNILINQPIF